MTGTTGYTFRKNKKTKKGPHLYLIPYTKIKQKLTTDLKVEANSKKLLKEILGEKLCNNGVGKHKKNLNYQRKT